METVWSDLGVSVPRAQKYVIKNYSDQYVP